MTGVIATIPRNQFFDQLGKPLAGGKLYTYLAGTTTPVTTYQDQALTIKNQNPIPLDALGSCSIWLDPAKTYKLVLKTAQGTTLPGWPIDNISGAATPESLEPSLSSFAKLTALAAAAGSSLVNFLQSGAGATLQSIQRKLRGDLNIMDFINDGVDTTVADCTAGIRAAVSHLATRQRGNLYCSGGKFLISDTIDFSLLGDEHRFFDIDLGGAEFIWSDPNAAKPMFSGYNNKSVRIHNFTLIGNATDTISKAYGVRLDSIQPGGSDLMSFDNFRVRFCDKGFYLGSFDADQNRVSDIEIGGQFVIENCNTGIYTESTNVDSLVVRSGIVSACTTGIELKRAGFIKLDTVTGYSCKDFIKVNGPIGPLLVVNCQSEQGDVVGARFFYRVRYDEARTGPVTFESCNIDNPIVFDYDPGIGSDAQTVNIIGGYFREMQVKCPDTVVNLIGTAQTAGYEFKVSGPNCQVNNIGSRIYGTVTDTAKSGADLTQKYSYMPGGRLMQWGSTELMPVAAGAVREEIVNFPKPFTQIESIVATPYSPDGAGGEVFRYAFGGELDHMTLRFENENTGAGINIGASWLAIGR